MSVTTITQQEKDQITRDIKNIFENLKVVHTCDHEPEVEVRCDEYKIFRHTMCRACWNHETYHKINRILCR